MDAKRNKRMILVSLIIIIVLVCAALIITSSISKYTGFSISENPNDFIECLKEQDITIFINSENPSETLKGISSYDYLSSAEIINCKRNNNLCLDKGVSGPFPSWIINDKLIKEDISIAELSESSGCKL